MIALTAHEQGTILPVRAQPGARKNAIVGERAGALRVAVSAAPERGKANAAILDFLATALGCKASRICLLSGATARDKRFLIAGVTVDELQQRLGVIMGEVFTTEHTEHTEKKTEKREKGENRG